MDKNRDISLWIATTPQTDYPPLTEDEEADAVVVGGGIAGLSTALALRQKDIEAVLIESDHIVTKTTGNTTAKVTSLHGLKYASLLKNFSEEGVAIYAQANQEAISYLKKLVDHYQIDCDCHSADAYTYAVSEKDKQKIEQEVEAANKVGLPADFVGSVPLPYQTYGAIRLPEQIQFHVRKYLLGVAKAFIQEGGKLYENTRAMNIEHDGTSYKVITDKATLRAKSVVIATHKPFYDPDGIYTDMPAFRDYALGVLLDEPTPQGMYFSTGEDSYSIRYQPTEIGDVVILGGGWDPEDKAPDPQKQFAKQQDRYAKLFKIKEIPYQWYTHDYILDDDVPSIGRLSESLPGVYVATAFGGWGMTTGIAAGMMLSDLIVKGESQWSPFFDYFSRKQFRRKG